MYMRIGLTGGTGFIGQWLLKLYAREHKFEVLTSGNNLASCFTHENVAYTTGDYSISSMEAVFAGCDCLIHLGGLLSTKEREESFFSYEENIRSSENLFLAAKDLGITNVVNISSRTVYDHTGQAPYEETMAPLPMNYYAVAKLAVEQIAALYNQKFQMKIKTLRLAQVFGPGGRNGYMMEVFRQKSENGEVLTVYDHQGKELLYVKDAARAILCACLKPDKKGVYNIGSGIFYTNAAIAETFCRVYGNKAGFVYDEKASGAAHKSYMSVSKAREELLFQTEFTLEDAIRDLREQGKCARG